MNFDFTDDQKALRDTLRRFLAKESPLSEARRVAEQHEPYSTAVQRGLIDMGISTLMLPEACGGIGLGALELCVVAEELGRNLTPVPLSSTLYLAAQALLLGSSPAQQTDWLTPLAGGQIATLSAPLDGHACNLPSYHDGVLHGDTGLVADALSAEAAVVLASNSCGQWCWVVCKLDDTVGRQARETIDLTRPWGQLRFDATPATALDAVDDPSKLLQQVRNRAAILIAFEQLGASDTALEMATEYARERKAFGRAIGSYQGIKHKLADIYTLNQLARAHCYYGAWALACGDDELLIAAAAARVSSIRALTYAAQENIQVHGGMGYTWELDCHLFYRRARQQALMLGDEELWNEQISQILEQRLCACA